MWDILYTVEEAISRGEAYLPQLCNIRISINDLVASSFL